MTQSRDNLTDDELNQVKDMVWNTYVQNKLIEKEAKALGLTVTDQELQNILNEGTNPMLLQTPFVNKQTGRFDANALKKFIADYKQAQNTNPQLAEQYQKVYNFWSFVEKSLRQQILAQKYQGLLSHCMLSNPIDAKMAYTDENEESNVQLASFPYSSINDNSIKITDADLKAKYDELKPRFKQFEESRDVKYVDFQVLASPADRAALQKTINKFATDLKTAEDPSDIIRKSNSSIGYLGVPVSKNAFPQDIAQRIDSMAVGSTYGPVENHKDNTINVIRLMAKSSLPDSVQFRAIQVGGTDLDAVHKTADSIYTALKGGANFELIAKKYNQTGEKTWLTTRQYENAPSMDKDTKSYIQTINTAAVNQYVNLSMTSGNIIIQVLDRKGMIDKYTAAVIKKSIDFSKDTYSHAYNKFSQFVSENQSLEAMQKNASKFGFKVKNAKDVRTSQHYVGGIHSTREALKWIFQAKEGDVSPLYECGNNDHLLVMAMTKIHPIGYRGLDDAQVNQMVKHEVLRDKKADMIIAKLNGVKSLAAAQAKGGKISAVNQITFAAPVFIPSTGSSEPALSGAVSAVKAGNFSSHAVKGNSGVYLFQVVKKSLRPIKFDERAYEQKNQQRGLQYASNFMQELYIKAKIIDNRYLFF
jgi:peptidyl-prolyl cis-trans isomerase D